MKISCLSLCLLSTTCWLYLTPTTGNKIFHFGPCMISMNIDEIRASFTAIKAIIQAKDAIRTISILSYPHSLHNFTVGTIIAFAEFILFYVDKVFKHCETEDSHVNRKISSIANSFLSIKKKFRQCNEKNVCECGEEAIEKYKQILTNYGQQSKDERTDIRLLHQSYSLQNTEHEVGMCDCGEDVKHKYGQLLSQYEKMDVASAALKALGELDILLDWMDKAD
ncbi:interleukin-20-like [Pangshura tecta]